MKLEASMRAIEKRVSKCFSIKRAAQHRASQNIERASEFVFIKFVYTRERLNYSLQILKRASERAIVNSKKK